MKNKIVSAMLFGMAATLAFPSAAAFAEDIGGAVVAEAGDEAEPTFTDRLYEIKIEEETFGPYAEWLKEYITSGDADTSSLYSFEMAVIEKAEKIYGGADDSLTGRSTASGVAYPEAGWDNAEAVRAAKYHIALAFEDIYGDEAVMAGIEIRESVMEDEMAWDTSFDIDAFRASIEACSAVADADIIYAANKGPISTPKTVKEMNDALALQASETPENGEALSWEEAGMEEADVSGMDIPDAGAEGGSYAETPANGQTDVGGVPAAASLDDGYAVQEAGNSITEPQAASNSAIATEAEPQAESNSAITEEVQATPTPTPAVAVSDPVPEAPTPAPITDSTTPDVGTVTEDSLATIRATMISQVDCFGNGILEGEYLVEWVTYKNELKSQLEIMTDEIAMQELLNGMSDKYYEIYAKQDAYKQAIADEENTERLREKSYSLLDGYDVSKLTGEYLDSWNEEKEGLKAEISTLTTAEEMQAVLDKTPGIYKELYALQQLEECIDGYVDAITEYHGSLAFDTKELLAMGEDALDEAIENIQSATTLAEAAAALDNGKAKLTDISTQGENTLKTLRANAIASMSESKEAIQSDSSMVLDIYNIMAERINDCKKAQDIDVVMNSVNAAFGDIELAAEGDADAMNRLLKDLKGVAQDSDTTAMIDYIISLDRPEDIKGNEQEIKDVCAALRYDVAGFNEYMEGRTSEDVAGATKTETYTAYIEAITSDPEAEALAKAKEAAINGLMEAAAAIEGDEAAAEAASIIDAAKENINNCTDTAAVDVVKEAALSSINELAEKVKAQKDLAAAKEEAKETIKGAAEEIEDEGLYNTILDLVDRALANIDGAADMDELEGYFDAFFDDLETASAEYSNNKELAKAKTDTLAKLSGLTAEANSAYLTEGIQSAISSAKAQVSEAATKEDCDAIYKQAKEAFDTAYAESMRKAYLAKLDALITNNQFSGNNQASAQAIVDKQKANIQGLTNEAAMEKCYQLAETQVKALAVNSESSLAASKTAAIQELKDYVTVQSDSADKIVQTYANRINSATTEADVASRLKEAKSLIDQLGAHVDGQQSVYSPGYVSGGVQATATPTPIPEDPNTAQLNNATATTLYDENGQIISATPLPATGKDAVDESSLLKAGNIQTGDTNGGAIAGAFAALAAAAAAIFATIKKRLRTQP